MNVLIFVTTLLMVLAALTYGRLETFRNSQAIQPVLVEFMTKEERGYINQGAEDTYDKMTVKVKAKEGSKSTPVPATSKINISLLLNPEQRNNKEHEWQQTQLLLKRLMEQLYQEQPFYRKMQEKNPQFIDEIVADLAAAIEREKKEKRPKEPKDLALVELSDPQLNEVLYKMLRGTPCPEGPQQQSPLMKKEKEEDTGEVEPPDSSAYRSVEGYCSLLDFITKSPYHKIRVYLAPKEVLKTIYGDDKIVESILQERQELHRRATKDEDLKELTSSFKTLVDSYRDPNIDSDMVDYSVTKTTPKNR